MPKFYVQSGNLKLITTASDAPAAAIWAAHRALSQTLPFLSESDSGEQPLPSARQLALADTVRVSELGFDRPDCEQYETLQLVAEWSKLLLAIDRLQHRLAAA